MEKRRDFDSQKDISEHFGFWVLHNRFSLSHTCHADYTSKRWGGGRGEIGSLSSAFFLHRLKGVFWGVGRM